nr:hypothetical protein [uncultured Cohaesibacter sp.]
MRDNLFNPLLLISLLINEQNGRLADLSISIKQICFTAVMLLFTILVLFILNQIGHNFFLSTYETGTPFFSKTLFRAAFPLHDILTICGNVSIGLIFIGMQSEMRYGATVSAILLSIQMLTLLADTVAFYVLAGANILLLELKLGWSLPSMIYSYWVISLILILNFYLLFRLYRWIGKTASISSLQHPFFTFYILLFGLIFKVSVLV